MDFHTTPPINMVEAERRARALRAQVVADLIARARARVVALFAVRGHGAQRHA